MTEKHAPGIRVVLHVDDSQNWHEAARLAARYVREVGGELTLVTTALLPGARQRALADARRVVELPDANVRTLARPGLVEYVLPEIAREIGADAVLVGRLGSVDRLTSGLISLLIMRRTPASVLIVRGRPRALDSILLCTEGSRHGLANFERAANLAKAMRARLVVLHVLSQMSLRAEVHAPWAESDAFLSSDHPVAEHLREVQRRLREEGIEGEVQVRTGLVVEEILDALREGRHDLLVIGAHHAKGREELLYEDFASHLLRSSPVSTLVVRDPGRR